MARNKETVFIANNLQDVIYHLKTISGLQLIAGGTRIPKMEDKSVALKNIPELRTFEKKERYLDIGAAVTLSELIALGKENIPAIFHEALCSIGTEPVRNLATIGGNIASSAMHLTLWAPLLAMDAKVEYKNHETTKTVPFAQYKGVPEGFVITKVKVPIDDWEISIFRKTGPRHVINDESGSFVFLADTQKGIISSVRIAFAGIVSFRPFQIENKMIGNRLPLTDKFITQIIESTEQKFDEEFSDRNIPKITKDRFINLLRMSLQQLT